MRTASRFVRRALPLILLLLLASTPRPGAAQVQVSRADSAAVLLEAARAFEEEGRWQIAEALYLRIQERYRGTPAAGVAAERLALPAGLRADRSGRTELQVWTTTYGLWLGVAVPGAFGADGSEPYGVGLLVGGPVGLLTGRAVTRSRSLTEGQVRAITWGGTWGTWQGLGWGYVFDLGEELVCHFDTCWVNDSGSEERFASMIAGGLAGIATGALLARNPIRAGVAAGANYGSLWGSWIGLAGATVLDIQDDDDVWVATLLAGNAGLVAGALTAGAHDMSRNRVRLISLGGLVGLLGGFGIDLIAQPDSERAILGIPLATSLAGLGIAAAMTRDYDARGGGAAGASGPALFNRVDGAWSLAAPVPLPTRVPDATPSGRIRWSPGVSVELLRAVF